MRVPPREGWPAAIERGRAFSPNRYRSWVPVQDGKQSGSRRGGGSSRKEKWEGAEADCGGSEAARSWRAGGQSAQGLGHEGGRNKPPSLCQLQAGMELTCTARSDSEAIGLVLSSSPAPFCDVEDHAAGSSSELVSKIGVVKSNPLYGLSKRADALNGQVMNVETHGQGMRAELVPDATPRNLNPSRALKGPPIRTRRRLTVPPRSTATAPTAVPPPGRSLHRPRTSASTRHPNTHRR